MEKMLASNKFAKINEVTIKTIHENNLNFMIVWKDETDAKNNNFYTRETSLRSEYDGKIHKESDESLIKQFDTYYANHEEDKLFVLQAQRTAKTLLGKPSEYEKKFANKVTDYVLDIKNDPVLLNKTNIIMRDFLVSDVKKVNSILSLNIYKELIKPDKKESYSSFVLN